MTRETKLGLVVAGAFVSLLTVVVYHKLQEDASAAQEPPQVMRTDPKPVAPKKGTPAADPNKSNGVVNASLQIPAPKNEPNPLPIPSQGLTVNPTDKVSNLNLPPVINAISNPESGKNEKEAKAVIPVKVPDPKSPGQLPPDTTQLPMSQSLLNNLSPPPSQKAGPNSVSLDPGQKQASVPEQPKTDGAEKPPSKNDQSQDRDLPKQGTGVEVPKVGGLDTQPTPAIQPVGAAQIDVKKGKENPVSPVTPTTTPANPIVPLSGTVQSQEKKEPVKDLSKEPLAKVEPQTSQQGGVQLVPAAPALPGQPLGSLVDKATLPAPPGDIKVPSVENKLPSVGVPAPPLPGVTPPLPAVDNKLSGVVVPSVPVSTLPNNPTSPPGSAPTKDASPGVKVATPAAPIPNPTSEKDDIGLPPGWYPYDPKKAASNSSPAINQVRAENVGNPANPGGFPSVGSSGQPIGSALPVVTAPSPPPTQKIVGDQPKVAVTDVQLPLCKPEDKSFADLSIRYYSSDKYAAALLKYNRESHQPSPGIVSDPPQLAAGMVVRIPPVSKLEESYSNLIPNYKPLVPIPVNSSVTSMSPAPPPPTNVPVTDVTAPTTPVPVATAEMPAPPAPPKTLVPVAVTTTPEGMRQYQVEGQGEMLYDIAQKTLGNASRWSEILRLNPQVDPRYLIQAGTRLRLP